MKKILMFTLLLFITFAFVGCDFFAKPTTTTTTTTTTTVTTTTTEDTRHIDVRVFLLQQIDKFGTPEDTDLVFEANDTQYAFGNPDPFVLWERDSSINLILLNQNKQVFLEIVLDSGTNSVSTEVWNIMITYQDTERELYVYLDYYFYGRFLIEDYAPIVVEKNQRAWAEELLLLSFEDIEWLLTTLGYDVSEPA